MEGTITVQWLECPQGCTQHAAHWDRSEEPTGFGARRLSFPKLRIDRDGKPHLETEDGDYDDRH